MHYNVKDDTPYTRPHDDNNNAAALYFSLVKGCSMFQPPCNTNSRVLMFSHPLRPVSTLWFALVCRIRAVFYINKHNNNNNNTFIRVNTVRHIQTLGANYI